MTHYLMKTVAIYPDSTGKYRVSVSAFSDSVSKADADEYAATRFLPSIIVEAADAAEWSDALAGRLCGYADTPDLAKPVMLADWFYTA